MCRPSIHGPSPDGLLRQSRHCCRANPCPCRNGMSRCRGSARPEERFLLVSPRLAPPWQIARRIATATCAPNFRPKENWRRQARANDLPLCSIQILSSKTGLGAMNARTLWYSIPRLDPDSVRPVPFDHRMRLPSATPARAGSRTPRLWSDGCLWSRRTRAWWRRTSVQWRSPG